LFATQLKGFTGTVFFSLQYYYVVPLNGLESFDVTDLFEHRHGISQSANRFLRGQEDLNVKIDDWTLKKCAIKFSDA